MKAESVYDIFLSLTNEEKKRFLNMLSKPMPEIEVKPWLDGWKGLSEYLGGCPITTLSDWEKEGLIKKYKIGKRVFFKKEEINQALIPVE